MNKTTLLTSLLSLAAAASASAAVIDTFDGDLSNYTSTVILDANGGGSNTANWQITGSSLELNTTTYDGIEQYAMIYNGLSLTIGQEVQVSLTHNGGNQDLGLYVGGTVPVTGTRQDYVAVYARGNGQVFSRGFDGVAEYGLAGGSSPTYDKLFIARTGANEYELGYYDGVTRSVIVTRTPAAPNDGDVVGFYADVRGAGVLGNLDTLEVIPEPSIALLGGLGLIGLLRRRRA